MLENITSYSTREQSCIMVEVDYLTSLLKDISFAKILEGVGLIKVLEGISLAI